MVIVFCNFWVSIGALSISNKRYDPPCKSKPKFIFLLKKLYSDFKKLDDAIKIKKKVIIVITVILNLEKYNTLF